MIRPATLLCGLLAAGSGMYLYQAKHQAQVLDRVIADVQRKTAETVQHTGVLHAEFALMNDPARLQDLTHAFLPQLQPLQPGQFVRMADLDQHLPLVGQPVGPPPPIVAALPSSSVLDFPRAQAALVESGAVRARAAAPPVTASVAAATLSAAPAAMAIAALAPAPAPARAASVVAPASPRAANVLAAAAAPEPSRRVAAAAHVRQRATVLASRTTPSALRADPLAIPASAPAFPPQVAAAPPASLLGMARGLPTGPSRAALVGYGR